MQRTLVRRSAALVPPPRSRRQKPQTVCLAMIVKNESAVIERCLNSARHLFDYWVICDTGSDDGTPEIITQTLSGIPGELHKRPWRNFGSNRTELMHLARGKADYLLLLDADMIVADDETEAYLRRQ